MKKTTPSLWSIFAWFILGVVIGAIFKTIIWTGIILGAIGAGGYFTYWLLKRYESKKEEPEPMAQPRHHEERRPEPAPVFDAESEGVALAFNLAKLNQRMRLDPNRDDEVLAKAESVISSVLDILERLAGDSSRAVNKIKIVINALAESYLPELVDPFLRLTPEARQPKRAAVLESLGLLEQKAADVVRLLNEGVTNELDVQAEFLKARFLTKLEA